MARNRRCRAAMHGASWQHGAPSRASATVADKAGVDVVDDYQPHRGRPHHHLPVAQATLWIGIYKDDGTSLGGFNSQVSGEGGFADTTFLRG